MDSHVVARFSTCSAYLSILEFFVRLFLSINSLALAFPCACLDAECSSQSQVCPAIGSVVSSTLRQEQLGNYLENSFCRNARKCNLRILVWCISCVDVGLDCFLLLFVAFIHSPLFSMPQAWRVRRLSSIAWSNPSPGHGQSPEAGIAESITEIHRVMRCNERFRLSQAHRIRID